MNEAIKVLLQSDDPDSATGSGKIVLVQCACGKWQFQFFHAADDSVLYGTDVFETKEEAAWEMAGRIIDLGIETGKSN
jgi:hypothetical protein